MFFIQDCFFIRFYFRYERRFHNDVQGVCKMQDCPGKYIAEVTFVASAFEMFFSSNKDGLSTEASISAANAEAGRAFFILVITGDGFTERSGSASAAAVYFFKLRTCHDVKALNCNFLFHELQV
ncbi:hypothetical protein CK934_14135 [Chitinophaga sp. MD30]|nr:hypothetical protein CK934_14135 [Chitinophaga sp. MD30]